MLIESPLRMRQISLTTTIITTTITNSNGAG
ncbi:thr operon leader peptide [Symbiopectobacterium purcellii]